MNYIVFYTVGSHFIIAVVAAVVVALIWFRGGKKFGIYNFQN